MQPSIGFSKDQLKFHIFIFESDIQMFSRKEQSQKIITLVKFSFLLSSWLNK